jgi:hypothetical protein
MERRFEGSSKYVNTELADSLHELTAALTKHAGYLKKNNATMEKLAQAIDKLDSTIGKETRLETSRLSYQLKQTISEFAQSDINPQFYQMPNYALVTNTAKINRASLPNGR